MDNSLNKRNKLMDNLAHQRRLIYVRVGQRKIYCIGKNVKATVGDTVGIIHNNRLHIAKLTNKNKNYHIYGKALEVNTYFTKLPEEYQNIPRAI